ncbi:hypothetical protein NDU88_003824 [Pleurodeles waltl]|uniref:Uncharacterized protein n=1 Tax=Pleurodeles waltl TaxID=8319 RepID=A0AAV7LT19_PLEWA|nr:hypothetical protein NDU88_003824 [Pleurodeles waltl]
MRASATPASSAAGGQAGEWRREQPLSPFLVLRSRVGDPTAAPPAYSGDALMFCSRRAWSADWSGRRLLREH